jgi:predicted permease
VRDAFLRRAAERGADEELRFHIDMEAAKNVRAGLSPREARRRALVAFGGLERHREALREGRRAPLIESLLADVRFALRAVRRSPGFAIVAVVTMALGVGATTATFSIANALLFRPPPAPDVSRVVSVQEIRLVNTSSGVEGVRIPWERFRAYEEATRETFGSLAAFRLSSFALRLGERTLSVDGTLVSEGYFPALGVPPAVGRFPVTDDAAEVVVSHRLWERELGAGAVGSTVWLDSRPFTVVGVAPEWFRGTVVGLTSDVWVPARARAYSEGAGWAPDWVAMVGRLAPGVSRARAAAEVNAAALAIPPEGIAQVRGAEVEPFTGLAGQGRMVVGGFMGLLLGLSFLVLLIASANIAGALLARSMARRREIAVRLALGAGRGRLVRHLLTESLILFLLGGAGGVALASAVAGRLAASPIALPVDFVLDVTLDMRVLAFALAVTAATGLVFGLIPALQSSRPDLVPALKDGGWGADGSRARARKLFVGAQVTLSVLLLLVATLTARSFQRGLAMDPGFDPDGVVLATVDLAPHGYDGARGREFYRQLQEAARALPGVRNAATMEFVLLGFEGLGSDVSVPEALPGGVSRSSAKWNAADPRFLETLGVELVAGRGFGDADDEAAVPVAIINETLAGRLFPGVNAVGRSIERGATALEVVGVVRDGKYVYVAEGPTAYVFTPAAQSAPARMTLHVRAPGAEAATLRALEDIVRALDPNVPLENSGPMSRTVDLALLPYRLVAQVVGIFGVVGLVLAAVGVYGVLSFQVARRTRELGVRRALGARATDLLVLVLREGVVLAASGCAAGVALGAGVAHLLRGVLLGVGPLDPVTFLGVPAILFAVAILASTVPALRAGAVEAVRALNEE